MHYYTVDYNDFLREDIKKEDFEGNLDLFDDTLKSITVDKIFAPIDGCNDIHYQLGRGNNGSRYFLAWTLDKLPPSTICLKLDDEKIRVLNEEFASNISNELREALKDAIEKKHGEDWKSKFTDPSKLETKIANNEDVLIYENLFWFMSKYQDEEFVLK